MKNSHKSQSYADVQYVSQNINIGEQFTLLGNKPNTELYSLLFYQCFHSSLKIFSIIACCYSSFLIIQFFFSQDEVDRIVNSSRKR